MLKKYNVVIAETSCLILLDKINVLDLLHAVFGAVTTTLEIAQEILAVLTLRPESNGKVNFSQPA